MLFQGQCFTVWLVSPRGAVLRRCSGAESWLSSERLANLGRACGHGLCPGSLSTLSRTTSPWWQESLVLLMWYFLLSFGRETGHLCCHHLLLSPQRPYKREQIPCMLTTGFPEPFLPFFHFHPPGRFLWNQKKKAKVSLTSSLRERWDELSRNGSQSTGQMLITKREDWCCSFQSGFCFPQLFWIKSKIPSRRKHSQLLQLSWQAKDNGSWHAQSPDIARSHWRHTPKWPQHEKGPFLMTLDIYKRMTVRGKEGRNW